MTVNEGAEGEGVLAIDVPEEAVTEFEWCEEGKSYREFLVPAAILNARTISRWWECDQCRATVIGLEPAGWCRESGVNRVGDEEWEWTVILCPECSVQGRERLARLDKLYTPNDPQGGAR